MERQTANLLFALVSRRYERGSIIVTSNRGFEKWGEILGDAMVAAALIDRLVHHATMVTRDLQHPSPPDERRLKLLAQNTKLTEEIARLTTELHAAICMNQD